MRSTIPTMCLALSLGACTPWYSQDQYAFAVFSEDNQGVAAVHLQFEEHQFFGRVRDRNHETQVLMKEDLSPSVPPAITPVLPGKAHDLFFMRESGYLILGRWGDPGEGADGSEIRAIWYDHITMDGTMTSLGHEDDYVTGLSCDGGTSSSSTEPPLRVVPSPDGTVLAKLEVTSTCDARVMTLTFLDPHDLSIIEGPLDLPDVEPQMVGDTPWWRHFELAWLSDDELGLGFWGMGLEANMLLTHIVTVDGQITEGVEVMRDCFFPITSSTSRGADDAFVRIDGDSGEITVGTNNWHVSECDM